MNIRRSNHGQITSVTFSVKNYDIDGDVTDESVFLHFGDVVRLKFANIGEIKMLQASIQRCVDEMQENYGLE